MSKIKPLEYYVNDSPSRLNSSMNNSNMCKANLSGDLTLDTTDWEITATTIYCDAVDDEVTLMVLADGTARCTGLQKYLKPDRETSKEMNNRGKKLGKQLACDGEECRRIAQYRDKLLGEK